MKLVSRNEMTLPESMPAIWFQMVSLKTNGYSRKEHELGVERTNDNAYASSMAGGNHVLERGTVSMPGIYRVGDRLVVCPPLRA